MKVRVKKCAMGGEPIDGGKKKKKDSAPIPLSYAKYSGAVDETGDHFDFGNDQWINNMSSYMKKNNPNSNIYRDEYQHHSINLPVTAPTSVSPYFIPAQQNLSEYAQFAKFGGQKNGAFDTSIKAQIIPTADTSKLKKFIKAVPQTEANIEAEQGEVLLSDVNHDGQIEKFDIGGKKHYAGGTNLNIEPGSFIFSDTPKMRIGGEILEQFGKPKDTKKKYTPAELAKQYDLNFFKEKADDKLGDKFSKDTAELMLHNNKGKLANLAFVQEAMKGFPTGIPGITDRLMQDDNDQDKPDTMKMGGLVKADEGGDPFGLKKMLQLQNPNTFPYLPNNITPYVGDNFENRANASKHSAKEIGDRLRSMGYPGSELTGSAANKHAQQWLYNNSPESRTIIDQSHATPPGGHGTPKGGLPRNGNFDGMWGYRWDSALFNNQNEQFAQPNYETLPDITINSKRKPVNNSISTGNANFNNGQETSLGPNMWDKLGVLHAALRPIDHIRPQLFRTDANISDPTLMDNTATIQQLQSIANSNNETIQNTASGPIGRANISGNIGKLFDPINQSNMQTQNANVGIVNQFKGNRDAILNNKAAMNLDLLNRFTDQNNQYKANLSKEKQLKYADTVTQGQNMTNNMITLGSILAKTPNFTVGKNWWNPMFKPGVDGANILGDGQGSTNNNTPEMLAANIKSLMAKHGINEETARAIILRQGVKVTTKDRGNDRIIDNTEETSYK